MTKNETQTFDIVTTITSTVVDDGTDVQISHQVVIESHDAIDDSVANAVVMGALYSVRRQLVENMVEAGYEKELFEIPEEQE